MHQYDEEEELRQFLLGELPADEHERLVQRLADDDRFFLQAASHEDALIMQFHQALLSLEEQQAFERVYRASPERWARVEWARALLDAARAWKMRKEGRLWNRAARWLAAPWIAPRLLVAAGATVLIATSSAITYVLSQGAAGQHVVATFTLTALGERGRAPAQTLDRLRIPWDADEMRLVLEIDGGVDEELEVELVPIDGGSVEQPGNPSVVERTATGTVVTATVAASGLPDGDYVLRVRRNAGFGRTETVATRVFRATRTDGRTGPR